MEHQNPAQRAHLWEYGNRLVAAPEPVKYDYAHELPRHVHGPDGASKIVSTPDECDAAFAEGYQLLPYPVAAADAADAATDEAADEAPKKRGRKPKTAAAAE